MKKTFNEPEITVEKFEMEDVMTASGLLPSDDNETEII